jgi:hypothetical protein
MKLLRANDKFIMDLAMQHRPRWSNRRLEAINACRRYLQATTMADIVNEHGTKIEDNVWTGTREVAQATYRGVMFNQQRPQQAAWGHWRSFLRTMCDNNRKLRFPLGTWVVPASDLRHPAQWVYDPAQDLSGLLGTKVLLRRPCNATLLLIHYLALRATV